MQCSSTEGTSTSDRELSANVPLKTARTHIPRSSPLCSVVTHCPQAWRCLSVGCFDEASRLSHANNDVLCWVASLTMCGDTVLALKTVEAYVIAMSVVAHERRLRPGELDERLVQRATEIMVSWLRSPKAATKVIGKSWHAADEECRAAVLDACDVVDWDGVHRWFLIALFLHDKEYKPPNVTWFRYFFALFTEENATARARPVRAVKALKQRRAVLQPLTTNEVEDILLSYCTKFDMDLISTITAWKTRHFRSAISSATAFLGVEDEGFMITDMHMRIMARFIRCMCLIEIGERTMAANDALELLRCDDEFVMTVGSSISAFLVPVPQAVDVVTSYKGPIPQRRYAHALCEYIHALTLVQLGSLKAAVKIIQLVIPLALDHDVGEWLLDLLTIACTGLEDSATILKYPLSPQRQLYIAMCPAFFGGFGRECAKLHTHTPAGRLLYPKKLLTYVSLRQSLPYYMNRTHYQIAQQKYIEAWEQVCLAVGCAEEIVGSVEFAFTECSPLCAYYLGCTVGVEVLQRLLEVMMTREAVANGVEGGSTAEMLQEEGDLLGEEVLRKCLEWAQRIRQFHPNARLGSVALSQYFNMSRKEQFISRAICLARRYPRCVLAQNCLTLALYANHHIPEAVDQAARTLETFPHSREVVAVHRSIAQKDGTYIFNYRTLFPVRYAPGSQRVWTKRMIVVMVLLFVNTIIFLVTLLVNMSNWLTYPESIKELAIRLQLPSVFPLLYAFLVVFYAILAGLSPRNLTRTMMQDLFFSDTRMNRFLFALRGIAFVNTFNAMQITLAGNNFLFDSNWYTFFLYLVIACVFVPFTTRVWFLPSLDEPKDGVWTWLTLFAVDTATAFILVVPHIILFAVEPIMFIIFFFFQPVRRPDEENVSGYVGKRLLLHQEYLKESPFRYTAGSGSRFIHIRLMSLLYYKTHSDLTTKHLVKSQLDEDNYRVFPLIEVLDYISTEPVDQNAQIRPTRSRGASVVSSTTSRFDGTNDRDGGDADDDDDDDDDHEGVNGRKPLLRRLTEVETDENNNTHSRDYGINNDDGSDTSREEELADFCLGSTLVLNPDSMQKARKKRRATDLLRMPFAGSPTSTMCRESDDERSNGVNGNPRGEGIGTVFRFPKRGFLNMIKYGNSASDRSEESDADNVAETDDNGALKSGRTPVRSEARVCLSHLTSTLRGGDSSAASNPLATTNTSVDTTKPFSRARLCLENLDRAGKHSMEPSVHPPRGGKSGAPPRRSREAREWRHQHANPDFTPECEEPLLQALQGLYFALISNKATDVSASATAALRVKKAAVDSCLTDLFLESKADRLALESVSCNELCCMVVEKMVKDGDNESNPLTAGNATLVEKLLLRLDATPIINTILCNGLLEHCVLSGYTDMFAVILTPVCVQDMELIHWESLLQAFSLESAPGKIDSLRILLKASRHAVAKNILREIQPLLQAAVRSTLISEASMLSQSALEEFLRMIKGSEHLHLDFWRVEGEDGQTIFSKACAVGAIQLVETLWSLGLVSNPNRVQSDGSNALMQAVVHERKEVVEWFCASSSGVTRESFLYRNPERRRAVDIAALSGLQGMLKEVMNRISQLDARGPLRKSPSKPPRV
ncbi:hypothetical protein DQ04_02481050 [Trypanosoma grayi]|uniref:hypothetical protein n=1 Tax=Trypanosoma grayi TaxID=71804 RepID=UPI0004F4B3E1|nr:hypothetical protein DQ04_02481050 [Trypanosoma grayi]KEG11570.1 hypothetical protein DQ04_02481050 [Trypanosoma grayi]